MFTCILKVCCALIVFRHIYSSNFCLFVCMSVLNSGTDLPQIFTGQLCRTTGMFIDRFKSTKLNWLNQDC